MAFEQLRQCTWCTWPGFLWSRLPQLKTAPLVDLSRKPHRWRPLEPNIRVVKPPGCRSTATPASSGKRDENLRWMTCCFCKKCFVHMTGELETALSPTWMISPLDVRDVQAVVGKTRRVSPIMLGWSARNMSQWGASVCCVGKLTERGKSV
jgi:hypothetical protein